MSQKLRKKYFNNLLKQYAEKDYQQLQSVVFNIFSCKQNVCRSLRTGNLELNPQQIPYNSQRQLPLEGDLKIRKLTIQRQIENLKRNQFATEDAYQQARKELTERRKQQIQRYKEEQEKKNQQIEEKVKKWSEQLKQYDRKRSIYVEKRENEQKQKEQRLRQMEQEESENMKRQRQKQILNRLKELEESKQKREEFFNKSKFQTTEKLPLFLKYEKKYKQFEDEKKFEENLARKNHKLLTKINHESLKMHERQFLHKIKERNEKFEESQFRAKSTENNTQFSLFPNRDDEKFAQQAEKRKRRNKFDEKVKDMPLSIDEKKRVQMQIEIDKSKNPLKYNFLSQKSLNQFQIYGEFKDFAIHSSHKEIGKGYLEEVKKKVGQSRVKKSSSISAIRDLNASEKIEYRNYLDEFKMRRRREEQNEERDEIEKILKLHKNKEKAFLELKKKSEMLENEAFEKGKDLKNLQGYRQTAKRQSQMNEKFTKALKAKIKMLQIKS